MIYIGYFFIILGALFYALGGFGIFRMPDVFNRIQAGTKASTLGTFSLLIGVGFLNPTWFLKIFLIIVFIAITNPISSSVLSRAAYISGVKPVNTEIDELSELYSKRGEESGNI